MGGFYKYVEYVRNRARRHLRGSGDRGDEVGGRGRVQAHRRRKVAKAAGGVRLGKWAALGEGVFYPLSKKSGVFGGWVSKM